MKKFKALLFTLVLSGVLGASFAACSDGTQSSTDGGTSAGNSASESVSDSVGETEKAENAITLSVQSGLTCGAAPTVEASATHGEPEIGFAKADGVTAKEELTYLPAAQLAADFFAAGTYYVKASVAETQEYQGATEYKEFTVAHLSYEAIEGEPVDTVAPDAASSTQGYSVKECACGEEIHGEYTILVSVTLNGAPLCEEAVKVGEGLQTLVLPTREGYALKLYKDGEAFEFGTYSEFTALALTSRWVVAETGYDYAADVEAQIAALPTAATAENAESVLAQIAEIEEIVNAHYTEEEKAAIPAAVAELKAAATEIVNSTEYQLNVRLSAIPEWEDMEDETATLRAVLDYEAYVQGLDEADLASYTEPRKISIYKHYFSGEQVLFEGLNGAVETNAYIDLDGSQIIFDQEGVNIYTITLPKLPYKMLTGAKLIAVLGGTAENVNSGYTLSAYGETLVDALSKTWFWVEVLTDGEGYYVSIYDTDLTEGNKVALPEAVVNGEEGLTFSVSTAGAWDWMKFRQDGSVEKDTMVGTLKEFESNATVYQVNYSYTDDAGAQSITQYYLDGEALAAPQLEVSYTDKIGTHTFSGWGETVDTVTGDLSYTAVYETEYKEYSVTFLDAEYGVFEEKADYHYGDKVVLPASVPEKAKEGDWLFEFTGWYNGETQVTAETVVEMNMEIAPRFKQVYDGACYTVTVESAGTQTEYEIPVLAELQKEAISQIPETLERANYTFLGYTDKESGEEVVISELTAVNADMVLVANWQAEYVAAAKALPANAAAITDEAQTYDDLVAYIALLSEYSEEELEGYEDPTNVVLLKQHYAGVKKIYTFTTTDDSNISTTSRFEKVATKADAWYQDDQGNGYGGYIQATFDLGDGDYSVTLPKIQFGAYKEVSFGVYGSSNTAAVQLSINGNGAALDNSGSTFYVVEIHGKDLEVHNMNGVDTLFTATLTDAQYNGTEGLTLNVTESGWSCLYVSHIHGELKDAIVSESSQAALLLAKLPADTASITDETQTYDDLVAYLEYVAKNPVDGYTEPANVTALKAYYQGKSRVLASGLITSVTSNANYEAGNGRIMTGASDNTYTFTLPKINYSLYSEVSCITVFGGANSGYTFKAYGTTFVNTSKTWNWVNIVKVGAEGKTVKDTDTGADLTLAEGYYLAIGSTDSGAEWYKYVQLSDAVVNGEEGLTFSVTTAEGAWDWLKFRQDGSVETDNLVGKLA